MRSPTILFLCLSSLLSLPTLSFLSPLSLISPPRTSPLHLFGLGDKDKPAAADDILTSPAFLKKKIDVLKAEIKGVEATFPEAEQLLAEAKDEWLPQLTRLRSEYDFIKQRSYNATRDTGSKSTVKVVSAVLEVVDNFNRAFQAVQAEGVAAEEVVEEFRTIYAEIEKIFAELAVEEIETVGAAFDYELHQAITQMSDPEYEEGVVCKEFQKGYKLKETLIRPAMVAVAL